MHTRGKETKTHKEKHAQIVEKEKIQGEKGTHTHTHSEKGTHRQRFTRKMVHTHRELYKERKLHRKMKREK
jgi:hypothetical protein